MPPIVAVVEVAVEVDVVPEVPFVIELVVSAFVLQVDFVEFVLAHLKLFDDVLP